MKKCEEPCFIQQVQRLDINEGDKVIFKVRPDTEDVGIDELDKWAQKMKFHGFIHRGEIEKIEILRNDK